MKPHHRERDIKHFDRWARTYDNSWLQRALFDQGACLP